MGIVDAFHGLGAEGSATLARRGAGHQRGADHHGGGPVCGHSGGGGLQPVHRADQGLRRRDDDFCRELLNSLDEIPVRATPPRSSSPANPPGRHSGRWTVAFTSSRGQTRTSLAEINITPLVDVVLVLLIIFMITAPVLQSGIEVAVPKTRTVKEITEQRLVVTIDREQQVFLGDQPVNIHELAGKLRQADGDPIAPGGQAGDLPARR
jgi:biopolymer transport protein ExbD